MPIVWARTGVAEPPQGRKAGEALGEPRATSEPATASELAAASEHAVAGAVDQADSASSQIHVKHDPKIHHRPAQSTPALAKIAGSDDVASSEKASESESGPGTSAAFLNSVAQQQKTLPQTTPALADGVADEVADQTQVEAATPATADTPAKLVAARDPRLARNFLSSRTMPAGSLITRSATPPHIPSVEEEVLTPTILPTLQPVIYNRRGHLIMPAAMKGTHEILVHQNTMANSEGLARIQDESDLLRMRSTRLLVPLPQNATLRVDERLPANRRYCRPWTEVFLVTLARAHYARFHTPLQINSAVRTVAFQERLIRTNGNAAPAEGLTASPHLTGQAVDMAKHGLSMTEIAWLRGYLMPLVQEGKIDVEEEFQQSCFHISVYKGYLPQPAPRRFIAEKSHHGAAALAAVIR